LLVQNQFDQPQSLHISNAHVNVKNGTVDEKINNFEAFHIDNIKDQKMGHHARISSVDIDNESFILHSSIVNSDTVEYDSEELENN
jgi:hypothetical protein